MCERESFISVTSDQNTWEIIQGLGMEALLLDQFEQKKFLSLLMTL